MSTEKYLRPEVIRQVARLDLRAKFIVEGFLAGLHASPFHGFSVEFSEHRKYVPGDDLKDLDWNVYAKTDKYYLKKFQAETNVTGYLVMDLSASMAYTYRQELTKFEYAICLAAALGYLMIHQQDPVGLVTFDTQHPDQPAAAEQADAAGHHPVACWPTSSRPARPTSPACLHQLAAMIRSKSLVMIFSDLLTDPEPVHAEPAPSAAPRQRGDPVPHPRRGRGAFPVRGPGRVRGRGGPRRADARRPGHARRTTWRRSSEFQRSATASECITANIDYVPMDTSVSFDKALMEYLLQRQKRF